MSSGSISAMITSLKNNARKRKTIYDNKDVFNKTSEKKRFITTKKATPEQLEAIRTRMKRENRSRTIRTLVITLTVIILIVVLFIFLAYTDA